MAGRVKGLDNPLTAFAGQMGNFGLSQQSYRAGVNFAGAVPGSATYSSAQLG